MVGVNQAIGSVEFMTFPFCPIARMTFLVVRTQGNIQQHRMVIFNSGCPFLSIDNLPIFPSGHFRWFFRCPDIISGPSFPMSHS
jgi:hypothetical protein